VEVEKKFLAILRQENPKLSEDAERPKKRAKIAKPEDVIETFDYDFE
jgi:hypothetical protein